MLREVTSPARLAGMLSCMRPPHFKETLQVCSATGPISVHTLGGWRQDGLHVCIGGQILEGTGANGKSALPTSNAEADADIKHCTGACVRMLSTKVAIHPAQHDQYCTAPGNKAVWHNSA